LCHILLLGSGKTLAFLLPIIEQIHKYYSVYGPSRAPNRPLSVVITPSRELADQIYVRWFLFYGRDLLKSYFIIGVLLVDVGNIWALMEG